MASLRLFLELFPYKGGLLCGGRVCAIPNCLSEFGVGHTSFFLGLVPRALACVLEVLMRGAGFLEVYSARGGLLPLRMIDRNLHYLLCLQIFYLTYLVLGGCMVLLTVSV